MEDSFELTTESGEIIHTKKIVLAGFIITDMMGHTNIKGIYAAGEIIGPSQLIVSASQGHMVGAEIIADSCEAAFQGI